MSSVSRDGLRAFFGDRSPPDPNAPPLTVATLQEALEDLWNSLPDDYNPLEGWVRIEGKDGWHGLLRPLESEIEVDGVRFIRWGVMRQNDGQGYRAYQLDTGGVFITKEKVSP